MHGVVRSARPEATASPEREVTHLSLDAARHGAPATRADPLVAEFVQNPLPGDLWLRVVRRGGGPPCAAGDAEGVREGHRVGIARSRGRPECRLVHQGANREVGEQKAPGFNAVSPNQRPPSSKHRSTSRVETSA